MATPEEIESALAGLKPGTRIRITTKDGRQVNGTYRGRHEGGLVEIEAADADGEGAQSIELANVDGLVVPLTSAGPE